jgi:Uma2 family endonuclease
MSEAYEETIAGEIVLRRTPGLDHEQLVDRLHGLVRAALPPNSALQLLGPRSGLRLADDCLLRPDLAAIRLDASGLAVPYLVAEVLLPGDHHLDTFIKKQVWSNLRLPRLWMIDPRYLNIEVYGLGEYGFTLQDILANHHPLTDPHLPGLRCSMDDFFRPSRRT